MGNKGCGVHCNGSSSSSPSSPTITDSIIAENRGGGIVCIDASPAITNNVIRGNNGGGIYCRSSSPTIANNTITANLAFASGGGIDCPSSTTIVDTIVAFNSSGIYVTATGTPTLRFNDVFGNAAYDYSGITDPTGTSGNVSADPLFFRNAGPGLDGQWGTVDDDYGDLRLRGGSPCIDAGENAGVPAGIVTDLDGRPRFVDEPGVPDTGSGTAPIVDIGAYEFNPPASDFDRDGDVDLVDFKTFQDCFNGPNRAYRAEGCAAPDFDADEDVDLVDFKAFQDCFNGPNRSPMCL